MQSTSSATLVLHALCYLIVESFPHWTQNSWGCWCFGKRPFCFNGSKQFINFYSCLNIFQYKSVEFLTSYNKNFTIVFTLFLCTATLILRRTLVCFLIHLHPTCKYVIFEECFCSTVIYISRNQQKEYEYLYCTEWNVDIKLEARLNGGKFDGWKISEVPTSSTSIIFQASKMFFIPYRGTKLYMARNIFCIHKVVIKVTLRNFFVEAMKITPFNGSIF